MLLQFVVWLFCWSFHSLYLHSLEFPLHRCFFFWSSSLVAAVWMLWVRTHTPYLWCPCTATKWADLTGPFHWCFWSFRGGLILLNRLTDFTLDIIWKGIWILFWTSLVALYLLFYGCNKVGATVWELFLMGEIVGWTIFWWEHQWVQWTIAI